MRMVLLRWRQWALAVAWGKVGAQPELKVKRRLRHLALLAGLAGVACHPTAQPPATLHEWQWRCDEAERAGLLWQGGLGQPELRDVHAQGDDWVGWDAQLGCWYVD